MKLWFVGEDGVPVLKECRLDRVVGRLCRARVPMSNANMKCPKGTRLKIIGYERQGWDLQLPEACQHCGLTGRVHSVPWQEILIDGPVPKPPSKEAIESARLLGGEEAAEALVKKWKRKMHYYEED